jgi:integrase
VEIPELMQPFVHRLIQGKDREAFLFGHHWRDWPRKQIQRICKRAGVPVISAHGMRGVHASLAEETGATSHMVTQSLGHVSITTTHQHYATQESVMKGRQRKVVRLIGGETGKKNGNNDWGSNRCYQDSGFENSL